MNKAGALKRIETKWDNLDRWVKRIIGAISTLGVIAGMFMGLFSWGLGQLDGFVDAKIEDVSAQILALEDRLEVATREEQLATTRLELTTLIAHNPTNVVEIEKVARYYFADLGGDWYMSGIYSQWAKEYGGDVSFVLHRE